MSSPVITGGVTTKTLRPAVKVLPGDARAHNRSLLLQSLFRSGEHSRADLLVDGLVRELGTRTESRIGKPATLVELNRDAAHIVTLDLSDDQRMSGAVIDLQGQVRSRRSVAREGRVGEAAVARVLELAEELVAGSDRPVLGAGVGTPGVVDPQGTVLDAPNLGWHDLPLGARVATELGLPVYVANEANTAALAEHTFGGAGHSDLLVVTIGQGVGAGLLLDGALIHGRRFAAGEMGHVVVDEDGEPCACGRTGCLETFVAVPRLRRRLAGDPTGALATAGRQLGIVLAPLVSTLNLGEIVLNGPADLLDGPFRQAALEMVQRRTMPLAHDDLVVRLSALHEDAVLLGAAVLVLSGQLGVA